MQSIWATAGLVDMFVPPKKCATIEYGSSFKVNDWRSYLEEAL
jgi:hypothetical protein